jgi:hypothetical protein
MIDCIVQKSFNEKTKFTLSSRLSGNTSNIITTNIGANVLGTIRHQYSPRWVVEVCHDIFLSLPCLTRLQATTAFFHPHSFNPKISYHDKGTAFSLQARIAPTLFYLYPPPIVLSVSQKLFPQSLTHGIVTLSTTPNPYISVAIVSPTSFSHGGPTYKPEYPLVAPGSRTGFGAGTWFTSYELVLADIRSAIKADWGIFFSELALQLKLGVELGVQSFAGVFSTTWHNESSLVSVAVGVGPNGVVLRLE